MLSDYVYRTRNLLHDATGRLYSDQLIVTNVNDARDHVARDSCCVRFLQTNAQYGIQLTANVEVYNTYSFLPLGPVTVDVMGVTVYWGNQRIELDYRPWSQFTAMLRPWQTYKALPCAFSRYAGDFYVGPKPDQNYAIDVDTALTVNKMFDDTTPEQIINPFQVAVPFYAAYLSKFYEQSFGEAQLFEQQYARQMANASRTWMRRTKFTSYPDT